MLQQTPAPRAVEKYKQFIRRFPTVKDLAVASNTDVLQMWQGLGYNRRALYLKKSAEIIVSKYSGIIPDEIEVLDELPGIGFNTASAIVSFAFNKPTIFIETNIRTVFIHFFFNGKEHVSDTEILPLVEKTVDKKNPRGWYYALMDYGAYLKKNFKNPSRKSKTYTKQTRFKGSKRQLRGYIVKLILERKRMNVRDIYRYIIDIHGDRDMVNVVLGDLEKEGLIKKGKRVYTIA